MAQVYLTRGKRKVNGSIQIKSAKNSILPIICSTVLQKNDCELILVPKIKDVEELLNVVGLLGITSERVNENLIIHSQNITYSSLDCDFAKNFRASIFLVGAMLTRFKQCEISLPGGCDIGKRNIDIHLDALASLGARYEIVQDVLIFNGKNMHSGVVELRYPSVGATINTIFASLELEGITTIINPAKEPEIKDLASFLNSLGYVIVGAGSKKISIYGRKIFPKPIAYKPIGDRIVAGTLLVLTTILGGEIMLSNIEQDSLEPVIFYLKKVGAKIAKYQNAIYLYSNAKLKPFKIVTGPFPQFPTDMQSIFISLALCCNGKSEIVEKVFEDRFKVVDEFKKFGACIEKKGNSIIIEGKKSLNGATVRATDLRAGAGLILTALTIEDSCEIENIEVIMRGYEDFDKILRTLGQDIKKIEK